MNSSNDALRRASALYDALLGRDLDEGARRAVEARAASGTDVGFSFAMELICSVEFTDKLLARVIDAHLALIHRARQLMVRRLLPPAASIIDLGGINAPLFKLGYPHAFERMVIVDLPPDDRHELYRDIRLDAPSDADVYLRYCDMTRLDPFANESFDLVWSGQSIEHVDAEAGARMCAEAYRVLRPGGLFCLDTPNRGFTSIHTRDVGGGFIHPEHKHEYHVAELRDLLSRTGFDVAQERGICEMPKTRSSGRFNYEDFVLGSPIVDDPEAAYIMYFAACKPRD